MQPVITPLVRTPRPYKFESLKGLILRSSEANAYDTPTTMLSSAGFTSGEMVSIIPPLEKLAPLFNLSITEITKLGYRKPLDSPSAKHIWIYNHQLPTYYLSIKAPKICTECIINCGFTESFWDLKHAIACPKHNRYLLKICPDCKKQLSWFRPGLLTCKCGCDLSKHKGDLLNNQAVLGLLAFLRNQLKREPHDNNLLSQRLGFPVEHLVTLTLAELLSIIVRFENNGSYPKAASEGYEGYQEEVTLAKVSQALENWPEGLYKYLDYFNNERASAQGFGLRKQFESFCGSLFKSDIPKEKLSFIKDAFIKFGNEEWKQGYVPSKREGNARPDARIVGINGLAKKLGVMPITARNMVKKDLIQGKTSELNGRARYFFDISQDLPFKNASGLSFTVRKAANWLGIPVSVLKLLRSENHFKALHIASPTKAYHEQDLIAFRDKLLKCCPVNNDFSVEIHITLKQVMLMKLGGNRVKALFVCGILNHELILLGNAGSGIGSMFFSQNQVNEFLLKTKRQQYGLTTVVAAAKYLQCDPLVVRSFYQNGLLEGISKPNGLFISEESLKAIAGLYVSCAAIASKLQTNSSKIVRICKEKRIDLHWFPRTDNLSPQPFIERKYTPLLPVTDELGNSELPKISFEYQRR